MNTRVNLILEQINFKLRQRASVEFVEAEMAGSAQDSADVQGGDGAATNASGVDDALQKYLSDLVDRLMSQYDASEEDAADIVFACIDELVQAKKMSELPAEDAPEQEVAAWIGRATTSGFPKYLDDFAARNAESEEDADDSADEGDEA